VDAVVDQRVRLLHRLLIEEAHMVVAVGTTIMRELLGAEPTPYIGLHTSIRDNVVKEVREFVEAHGVGQEERLLHTFEEQFATVAAAAAKLR
jgi:hypothetical protein